MPSRVSFPVAHPELVRSRVVALSSRAAERARRGTVPAPQIWAFRAAPRWENGDLEADGRPIRVVGCATPLQARAAAVDFLETAGDDDTLVLLTDLSDADLGPDFLSRLAGAKLYSFDSFDAVQRRFGVQQLDPLIGRHSWLADALLQVPLDLRQARSQVLTLEECLTMLSRWCFDAAAPSLERLLIASTVDRFDDRVAGFDSMLITQLCALVGERIGPAGELVCGAIAAGNGALALPAGLAATTLSGDLSQRYARGRIEAITGVENPTAAAVAAWATASEHALGELDALPDEAGSFVAQRTVVTANELAQSWQPNAVINSTKLPIGFEARLERLGVLLLEQLDSANRVDGAAVRTATRSVLEHRSAEAGREYARARRARLAARLVLWLRSDDASLADSFPAHVGDYLRNGVWVDAARRRVDEGDNHPAVFAEALGQVASRAQERALERNKRFGEALATWTSSESPSSPIRTDVVRIESVLERYVAPLADEPTLLIVLDGCGFTPFIEFVAEFRKLGFAEIGVDGVRHAALAAFPTVTSVSRTSLLTGTLQRGDKNTEQRDFASAVSRVVRGASGVLFHQHPDLFSGYGAGLPTPVSEAIASTDDDRRVVGVVINSIDDQLKSGTFADSYRLDDLGPLVAVLRAAAAAGRRVVLTADHGHVLGLGHDGTGDRQGDAASAGGERWQTNTRPLDDGEVVLVGPRVLEGGSDGIIVPWTDDRRYSARHGGYHGGGTPEEALVPLAAFVPPGVSIPTGWDVVSVSTPLWWELSVGSSDDAAAPVAPVPVPRRKKPSVAKPTPAGQTALFEPEVPSSESADTAGAAPDSAGAAPMAGPAWAVGIITSELYQQQLALLPKRGQPKSETVIAVLSVLHERGGTAPFAAIADATGQPVMRITGLLSGIEQALNIDGYQVLAVDRSAREARLDRALLDAQFGESP